MVVAACYLPAASLWYNGRGRMQPAARWRSKYARRTTCLSEINIYIYRIIDNLTLSIVPFFLFSLFCLFSFSFFFVSLFFFLFFFFLFPWGRGATAPQPPPPPPKWRLCLITYRLRPASKARSARFVVVVALHGWGFNPPGASQPTSLYWTHSKKNI